MRGTVKSTLLLLEIIRDMMYLDIIVLQVSLRQ
jgi:hypothetical protein